MSAIRRHRWKAISPICINVNHSVVRLCHVRALCSNGRSYRQDFFCIRQPHVSFPDCIKIWLTSSTPSSPNFAPKWPTTCWIERWKHSTANCGRIVGVDSGEPIGNHRWPPATSPFPKMGVPNAPQYQLRGVCCHLANMMDKISFAYIPT